jgi:hypothetical protein
LNDDNGTPKRAGFLSTVRAVLWSFAGVRKRKDYQQDATSLNPVHVIIAGVIAAAVFVLTIVLVVRFVVSQ